MEELLTPWVWQICYQSIWDTNALELNSMWPLVSIKNYLLIDTWSAYWPDCAIDKSKTCGKRWSSEVYRICIGLKHVWREKRLIPTLQSKAMTIYVIDHVQIYFAQFRNRTTKKVDHVTITNWVGKSFEDYAQSFQTTTSFCMWNQDNFGNFQRSL